MIRRRFPCDATFKFFINTAHGYTVLFRNAPPPPPPPPPAVCDFSTFGGFALSPNNISYGGNAGAIETGQAYGSLNFVNHTTGDQIHVWNVTGYHPSTGALSGFANSRYASGTGTINGASSFPVELHFLDNGEPGKNDPCVPIREWQRADSGAGSAGGRRSAPRCLQEGPEG